MKTTKLIAWLGLPAFFTVGYALSPSAPEQSRKSILKPLFGFEDTRLDKRAQAAAVLKEVRDARDPLEARLKLLSMIEGASPAELEQLFNSARLADDLSARNAAAQYWAETDPESLLKHLKGLRADEMEELNEVATILFRTWAHRDPEQALAMAKKSEALTGFRGSRGAAIHGALEDDPERGFALMAKEKNLDLGQAFKKAIWERDPARFVKASSQAGSALSNYGGGYYGGGYYGGRYGGMDPFGSSGYWGLAGARNEALVAWAAADFPAAMEWAKTLKTDERANIMPSLLGKLAEADLNQARSIFESLAPSKEREAAGPAIVAEWAKTDPKAALDWIEKTMTGGKTEAYSSWIRAVASTSMESAAAQLQALPEGNGRDYATHTLASEWAEKDVAGAVNWIRNMQDPSDRRDAYGNVVRQWAQKDPASFKDFVATVPKEELPEQYQYYLYGRTKEDQEKNLTWAASLPDDRREPIVLNMFSNTAWNRKPAEIVELLGKVGDVDLQAKASMQMFSNMIGDENTKAKEFLELIPANILTAQQREELRSQLPQPETPPGPAETKILKQTP